MSSHGNYLAMARRHVAQGEKHIARQEQIIAEMERDHHEETANTARRLLDTMRVYLRNAKAHVYRLERASTK
jgi:rubrerythrin